MGRIAFLTDRPPHEALPAVHHLGFDVKTEPLAHESLAHLPELSPSAVIVDAEPDPDRAYQMLRALPVPGTPVPVVVVVSPADLHRVAWDEVADEFVYSDTPGAELSLRLSMLSRRTGDLASETLDLGPLSIDPTTFRVAVSGRVLDLAYKEFELLRFLVERAGRVVDRGTLLQEVWGYNFYGGTRTVDVHVRRLRAKLGPQYESLIETVRRVGYRAAEPNRQLPEEER